MKIEDIYSKLFAIGTIAIAFLIGVGMINLLEEHENQIIQKCNEKYGEGNWEWYSAPRKTPEERRFIGMIWTCVPKSKIPCLENCTEKRKFEFGGLEKCFKECDVE